MKIEKKSFCDDKCRCKYLLNLFILIKFKIKYKNLKTFFVTTCQIISLSYFQLRF